MTNRRQSRLHRTALGLALRLWQIRRVLLLVIPYCILFGWLFSGESRADLRPGELYLVPEKPAWTSPDGEHWFGTTATGTDLFELSRMAMATSVSVAVLAVFSGIGLALLLVALFAFEPGERRFEALHAAGRAGFAMPAMVALVVLAGGSGGGLLVTILGLALVIAFHLAPSIAQWFEDGERDFDAVASYALGLSRRDVALSRVLPTVLRRLPGVFASLVPLALLAEMALSFMGMSGNRLSVGAMVAHGQSLIIEAPWMAIHPGILATAVVAALSLLGWRVSAALRTGVVPRIL